MSKTFTLGANVTLLLLLKTTDDSIRFAINLTSEAKIIYNSYGGCTISTNGMAIPSFCRDLEFVQKEYDNIMK